MTDYLLLYEGGDKAWMENATPEELQEVMGQWGAWFEELEKSGNLRNPGSALAPGGALLRTEGGAIETDRSLPEVKELVGGYSVIAAASLDEATELAKGCPMLKNSPTATVLVRPIVQM